MSEFHVEMPFPVSENQMYESNKPGSRKPRRCSDRFKLWRLAASLEISKAQIQPYLKPKNKARKMVWTYSVQLHVPINKFYTLDLGNFMKGPVDLIAKAINIDDRYIVEERHFKIMTTDPQGKIVFDVKVFQSLKEYDLRTMYEGL